MSNIENYFNAAELALAAYSDFSGMMLDQGSGALNTTEVIKRLSSNNTSHDFTTIAAEQFAKRFEVFNQRGQPRILFDVTKTKSCHVAHALS